MRCRTTDWYLTKVRYRDAVNDRRVTRTCVVDALSFAEAEAVVTERLGACATGDFKVFKIDPATFKEVFFTDMDKDDKWYKARLAFTIINEGTGKEMRSTIAYLVQAATLLGAVRNIEEAMSGTAIGYEVTSVAETSICDVFEHGGAAVVVGLKEPVRAEQVAPQTAMNMKEKACSYNDIRYVVRHHHKAVFENTT